MCDGKLFVIGLIKGIRDSTDSVINKEQPGFKNGGGCADQIYEVEELCEKLQK